MQAMDAGEALEAPEGAAPEAPPRRRRWAGRPLLRNLLGFAVLGAIVGGLVAFDRLSGDDDGRVVPFTGSFAGVPTAEAGLGPLDGRAPRVGRPAPEFALRDTDGRMRTLADYRGRAVWINFWATWCVPCRRELPDIQRLSDEFAGEGLVVLAVNFLASSDRAKAFWDDLGLNLPVLLDRSGDVAEQYRLRGFPDSFFIDRDGVLRALQIGFLTEDEMRGKLAEVGIR